MQQTYVIRESKALTADIQQFVFKPISDGIHYQAGQYVDLVLEDNMRRPFSIANAPTQSGLLEFHIKHQPDNEFTSALFDHFKSVQTIGVDGPFGHCVLPNDPSTPLLLLAGGTGLVPMKAMLEALFAQNWQAPVSLYWAGNQPAELYFSETLLDWQRQHPHFQYIPVINTLLHQYLEQHQPDVASALIYAAGPYPMVRALYQTMQRMGVKKTAFLSDML